MTAQTSLFDAEPVALAPAQAEVVEALRWLIVASDTTDVQRALREHNIPRERSNIARRLFEFEGLGLVERVGHNMDRRGHPTLWRRAL